MWNKKPKQQPGQPWTFVNKRTGEIDTGVLPSRRGESSSFAYWDKCSRRSQGYWVSGRFNRTYVKSRLTQDVEYRLRNTLGANRRKAVSDGYKPCLSTIEELKLAWSAQKGLCAACGGLIEWTNARLDHDHETGLFRGFVHHTCNVVEGHLKDLSNDRLDSLINWIKDIRNRRAVND